MMQRPLALGALVLVAVFALAACEKQQTMTGSARKTDTPVWAASDSRWGQHDFKAGDKADWERQMALRAQGQNDYAPRLDR